MATLDNDKKFVVLKTIHRALSHGKKHELINLFLSSFLDVADRPLMEYYSCALFPSEKSHDLYLYFLLEVCNSPVEACSFYKTSSYLKLPSAHDLSVVRRHLDRLILMRSVYSILPVHLQRLVGEWKTTNNIQDREVLESDKAFILSPKFSDKDHSSSVLDQSQSPIKENIILNANFPDSRNISNDLQISNSHPVTNDHHVPTKHPILKGTKYANSDGDANPFLPQDKGLTYPVDIKKSFECNSFINASHKSPTDYILNVQLPTEHGKFGGESHDTVIENAIFMTVNDISNNHHQTLLAEDSNVKFTDVESKDLLLGNEGFVSNENSVESEEEFLDAPSVSECDWGSYFVNTLKHKSIHAVDGDAKKVEYDNHYPTPSDQKIMFKPQESSSENYLSTTNVDNNSHRADAVRGLGPDEVIDATYSSSIASTLSDSDICEIDLEDYLTENTNYRDTHPSYSDESIIQEDHYPPNNVKCYHSFSTDENLNEQISNFDEFVNLSDSTLEENVKQFDSKDESNYLTNSTDETNNQYNSFDSASKQSDFIDKNTLTRDGPVINNIFNAMDTVPINDDQWIGHDHLPESVIVFLPSSSDVQIPASFDIQVPSSDIGCDLDIRNSPSTKLEISTTDKIFAQSIDPSTSHNTQSPFNTSKNQPNPFVNLKNTKKERGRNKNKISPVIIKSPSSLKPPKNDLIHGSGLDGSHGTPYSLRIRPVPPPKVFTFDDTPGRRIHPKEIELSSKEDTKNSNKLAQTPKLSHKSNDRSGANENPTHQIRKRTRNKPVEKDEKFSNNISMDVLSGGTPSGSNKRARKKVSYRFNKTTPDKDPVTWQDITKKKDQGSLVKSKRSTSLLFDANNITKQGSSLSNESVQTFKLLEDSSEKSKTTRSKSGRIFLPLSPLSPNISPILLFGNKKRRNKKLPSSETQNHAPSPPIRGQRRNLFPLKEQ